ncbi:MAG: RNA polymerase subunit sigma-24 [Clostridiales bacterium]|nr:RNA polymerase subunit sigma-24 [Clostridiales bacterium]
MDNKGQKRATDGSVVLYGVPKVYYGAYGGVTPLPICVKAVANYMGIDLDYAEAIVNCGAAFRLTWNEKCWDGGNVDAIFSFDDPSKVYRCAIESLGYEFNMLGRSQSTEKSEFLDFIKARLDKGIPVIALGIIGPPEAGIITGYRDNGNTLLGWNLFQEVPEYAGTIGFDESGYYVTDKWWENRDTVAVMSLGEAAGKKFTLKTVVENAIEVMTPRRAGDHAKGGYAYDAWKRAILDESQFGKDMIRPLLAERIMCQADAMDCLADGRNNAYEYFRKLADESREQPLFGQIAEQFGEVKTCAIKMYQILGGWERGEKQMQALAERENRVEIGKLIDKCKAADEKALDLLHKLLQSL